ncbi:MAG: hypothetical protein OXH99_11125 [Bryobacterales bacterium]|nr:hypothetical protein [Bryobacterales bacterium]
MATSRRGCWADSLAHALEADHGVETSYTEEVAERNPLEEHREGASAVQPPVMWQIFVKRSLYYRARPNKMRIPKRRFAPLRLALCSAEEILGEQAALEPYSNSETREQDFQLAFLNSGSNTQSRLGIVATLMCHEMQIGENGFQPAAQEMKSLLDRSLGDGHGNVPDVLTTGYHASLLAASNWARRSRSQTA